MENYKSGSHTRHDLKAHVVWITKSRKAVLRGEIAVRVREIIRQECAVMEVEILRGHVSKDHVHLFVGYPPSLSVSKMVQRRERKKFVADAAGIQRTAAQVLGPAAVGARILRGQQRQCDRRSDYGLHRATGPGAGERRFQNQR